MTQPDIHRERQALLAEINALMDKPMVLLAFVWLGLVTLDLTVGLSPGLVRLSYLIWALFIADFAVEFWLAPDRSRYFRENWMTAIAIMVPAFRIFGMLRAFRILQLARFGRSVTLVRLLAASRRGIRALRSMLGHHGFGYVVSLTTLVTFAGAAGMAHFESPEALAGAGIDAAHGLTGYGDALWWTAMVMTTMGSDYWPRTVEGRILGWLLAVYAFAVFGYITATIASYFVRTDAAAGRPRG